MKKYLPLLIACFVLVSLSGCKKTDDDSGALPNSVWKAKDENVLSVLRFIDDKTCSISTGRIGIDALNYQEYAYERGYGIDLFIYEKTDLTQVTPQYKSKYIGDFKGVNNLILYHAQNGQVIEISGIEMVRQR